MSEKNHAEQCFVPVENARLLTEIKDLKAEGYRFVQACADAADSGYEILYSFDRENTLINLRLLIAQDEAVESISGDYASAYFFEKEIGEQYGVAFNHMIIGQKAEMDGKTAMPFGPQHPMIPEPFHLDLIMEDGVITQAVPSFGYIHRGLEKLADSKNYQQMVSVMERVSGIDSFGYGWGAAAAIEQAMGIEIPERAEYLRTILQELSRIGAHLLWMALMADSAGLESLAMKCWKTRENILDLFEKTTGGRIIHSICKVGGMRRDIDAETLKEMTDILDDVKYEVEEAEEIFLEDDSVKGRLCGAGRLSKETAKALDVVGPMARSAGIRQDMRTLDGPGVYRELDFEPVIEENGDCYSRCSVRIREIYQSIELIGKAVQKIPEGPVSTDVEGGVNDEAIIRIEQPGGEAFYYVKGNGTESLQRIRVRAPFNINAPALLEILQGCDPADVPLLILSAEPCISGMER